MSPKLSGSNRRWSMECGCSRAAPSRTTPRHVRLRAPDGSDEDLALQTISGTRAKLREQFLKSIDAFFDWSSHLFLQTTLYSASSRWSDERYG